VSSVVVRILVEFNGNIILDPVFAPRFISSLSHRSERSFSVSFSRRQASVFIRFPSGTRFPAWLSLFSSVILLLLNPRLGVRRLCS
jgi:hypothetical protein